MLPRPKDHSRFSSLCFQVPGISFKLSAALTPFQKTSHMYHHSNPLITAPNHPNEGDIFSLLQLKRVSWMQSNDAYSSAAPSRTNCVLNCSSCVRSRRSPDCGQTSSTHNNAKSKETLLLAQARVWVSPNVVEPWQGPCVSPKQLLYLPSHIHRIHYLFLVTYCVSTYCRSNHTKDCESWQWLVCCLHPR